MKFSLDKKYNRKIAKAIAEFNLIEDGDNVLVGFSGGIDSAFLLYDMNILKENMSVDFEIKALTVDIAFSDIDYSPAREFCAELNIPYYLKKTKIADMIIEKEDNNPCASCSYFRKGAITEFVKNNNYKFDKIAYGHHYNDAVETFLMSIIYSGQIKTFMPKNNLTQAQAEVIRPLVNIQEKSIVEFMNDIDYTPINNQCPYEKNSKRKKIKDIINDFADQKQILYNLGAAIRRDSIVELWPEKLSRDKMKEKVYKLWQGD